MNAVLLVDSPLFSRLPAGELSRLASTNRGGELQAVRVLRLVVVPGIPGGAHDVPKLDSQANRKQGCDGVNLEREMEAARSRQTWNQILQAQWHRFRQPHFLWHAAFDPHGVASDRLGSPGRMENRVSFRVRGSIAHAKLETRLFYDGRSVETSLLPTTVLELASFGSEMTEPSLVSICRKQVRGTQLGARQLP